MRHDRRAIMRRAHELRRAGKPMGDALRAAWAEAKVIKPMAVPPQRLPLEAAAMGAWSLAKKLSGARRIEAALSIRIDAGLRITPKAGAPIAFAGSRAIAAGVDAVRRA